MAALAGACAAIAAWPRGVVAEPAFDKAAYDLGVRMARKNMDIRIAIETERAYRRGMKAGLDALVITPPDPTIPHQRVAVRYDDIG